MDAKQLLISFLTTFVTLIVFYLVKNYLPGYFGEKGKNQATKEDIGEITDIVENIKYDLQQQNEFLKAQLSFNNQHKLNVKSAEREAIFDFNRKISAWIYSVIRFTLSNYSLDNYKDLKTVSADFAKRQYECDLAEAHLTLFMHDKEFIELKRDLTISIINLQGIVEKSIFKVYRIFSKCEFDVAMEKDNLGKQSIIKGGIYNDLDPVLDAHRNESKAEYKNVHGIHSAMTRLINRRLKLLEE